MKILTTAMRILCLLALVVVALELRLVIRELRDIRSEQVKNAWYCLPDSAKAKAAQSPNYKREKENSIQIDGSVDVDVAGTVNVEVTNTEPMSVKIAPRSPFD